MADADPMTPAEEESFEQALARLEKVAERLESPDTPLEEAVALYEEGVKLAALCASRLEQAELRISELRPGSDDADAEA